MLYPLSVVVSKYRNSMWLVATSRQQGRGSRHHLTLCSETGGLQGGAVRHGRVPGTEGG